MLEFEVKAVVADPENLTQDSTIYLFNKEQGILLPIKMSLPAAAQIVSAHEITESNPEPRPHIHNTAIRIIHALEAEIDSVSIYAYQGGIFYSYITINKDGCPLEIDSKPSDAIAIALRHHTPIFVKKSVSAIAGIKVTRELLRNYI